MIKLPINNNGTMTIDQNEQGIKVNSHDDETLIPEGDFVMLINYYRWIKINNIQCDFINPYGIK